MGLFKGTWGFERVDCHYFFGEEEKVWGFERLNNLILQRIFFNIFRETSGRRVVLSADFSLKEKYEGKGYFCNHSIGMVIF